MTEFERQVLNDLSELKTQMRTLVGDGNAGVIKELEARVEKHEMILHRAGGVAAAVGMAVTLAHMVLNYLRLHR